MDRAQNTKKKGGTRAGKCANSGVKKKRMQELKNEKKEREVDRSLFKRIDHTQQGKKGKKIK